MQARLCNLSYGWLSKFFVLDGAEWVMIPNLGIARIVRDALLGFGLCALAIRVRFLQVFDRFFY